MARPRLPDSIKIANGTRESRLNGSTPQSPLGLGPAPDWLGVLAVERWEVLSLLLEPMRIATNADRGIAELYCQAYATWRTIQYQLRDEGLTITEDRGESGSITKAHPLLPTMIGLQKQMADLLGKFGMSPAARAALATERKPEASALAAFVINRGKASNSQDG